MRRTLDEASRPLNTKDMEDPVSMDGAVLGLLYRRPLHGYELYRVYSEREGLRTVWKVKRSRLYAILGRLGRLGLVEMQVLEQTNHPPRKVFRLSPEGLSAFRAWMGEPVSDSRAFRVEFPAKLYFAVRIDAAAARRLVERQRAVCEDWLRRKRPEAFMRSSGGEDGFGALVLRFRVGQLRAMTEWLSECEAYLERPVAESDEIR